MTAYIDKIRARGNEYGGVKSDNSTHGRLVSCIGRQSHHDIYKLPIFTMD